MTNLSFLLAVLPLTAVTVLCASVQENAKTPAQRLNDQLFPHSFITQLSPIDAIEDDNPTYVVTGSNGNCVLASMDIFFDITYETSEDISKTVTVQFPKNTSYSGFCAPEVGQQTTINETYTPADSVYAASLTLTWNNSTYVHKVSFEFDEEKKAYFIHEVSGEFDFRDTTIFTDAKDQTSVAFRVPMDDYRITDKRLSFRCESEKSYTDAAKQFRLKLQNFRYQIGSSLSSQFSPGLSCDDYLWIATIAGIVVGVFAAVVIVTVGSLCAYKNWKNRTPKGASPRSLNIPS